MDQLDRIEHMVRKLNREYAGASCPDCDRRSVVIEVPRGPPSEGMLDHLSDPDLDRIEIAAKCMGCGWFRTFYVVDQERYRLVCDRNVENSLDEQELVEEVFSSEECDESDFYMMKKDNNS